MNNNNENSNKVSAAKKRLGMSIWILYEYEYWMIFCHTVFRKDYVRRIDSRKDSSEILLLSFSK